MKTSGRTGEYRGKWVPCSPQYYNQLRKLLLGAAILSSARFKGEVRLEEQDIMLYTVAPPPYISGIAVQAAGGGEFPFRYVPPIAEAEAMSFRERLEEGFRQSLDTGIDYFMGVPSVLLRIGEAFSGNSERSMPMQTLLRPRVIFRLGKALLRSKIQKRSLLPKDIWSIKGIYASGTDAQVYKHHIESLWGIVPLEGYACTEFGAIAFQSWGARSTGLTMLPDSAFWEFIPEAEYYIWKYDPDYKPKTLTFDQLTEGRYVPVGTSFHGGAFVRYVVTDMISVISLSDEREGIQLPQIVVESRVDDLIDLASMVTLTERSIWRAIGEMGLPNIDWIVRKEYDENDVPFLHVFMEEMDRAPQDIANEFHSALINCVRDYATYDEIIQTNPITITYFSQGTFLEYLNQKEAEQADLGQLKPPRMQPPDDAMAKLYRISHEIAG